MTVVFVAISTAVFVLYDVETRAVCYGLAHERGEAKRGFAFLLLGSLFSFREFLRNTFYCTSQISFILSMRDDEKFDHDNIAVNARSDDDLSSKV